MDSLEKLNFIFCLAMYISIMFSFCCFFSLVYTSNHPWGIGYRRSLIRYMCTDIVEICFTNTEKYGEKVLTISFLHGCVAYFVVVYVVFGTKLSFEVLKQIFLRNY